MADPKKDEKEKKAPIIIKKIKKGGHGHHGGAWKVAYADFVTAMMAFFLLLWLLSSAPQETLKGISDYFTPTVGLKDGQGIGFDGGTNQEDAGIAKAESAPSPSVIFGSTKTGPVVKNEDETVEDEEAEQQRLIKVEDQIKENLSKSADLREFQDNIKIEMTPEGLRIQIIDTDKRPMFKPGSAIMEDHMKIILKGISAFIKSVPNYSSITGHTDSDWGKNTNYSNWEISMERANVSRRFMIENEFQKERVAWVVGKADREPLVPEDPNDPSNRRISIMLLKRSALPKHLQTTPEKLFLENQTKGDDSLLKFNTPQ